MTGTSPPLELLQQWMQSVITHPGGAQAGLASVGAQKLIPLDENRLENVILPSRSQSSVERLAIYADAYYSRLLQCLREMFPALRYAVGEEVFDDFAFGYLQVYPSRNYTLSLLAGSFVTYLESTRDEHLSSENEAQPAWSRFLVELARLEHTIDEVFDGPGIEGMPLPFQEQIARLAPSEWHLVRLVAAPSLRLLSFEFPVDEYFSRFRRDEYPDIPESVPSFLAIHRRAYVVRRYSLSQPQFMLLSLLCANVPLETALAKATYAGHSLDSASELSKWFAHWAAEDFFVQLDLSL